MVSNTDMLEVEIIKDLRKLRGHINDREFFDIVCYLLCVMEDMTEYQGERRNGKECK